MQWEKLSAEEQAIRLREEEGRTLLTMFLLAVIAIGHIALNPEIIEHRKELRLVQTHQAQ
jgi:hypothetical protein